MIVGFVIWTLVSLVLAGVGFAALSMGYVKHWYRGTET